MTRQYSLTEASIVLGIEKYRIQFALFAKQIPEPNRVGERWAFTDSDLTGLERYFRSSATETNDGQITHSNDMSVNAGTMEKSRTSLRPPVKWHGGKYYLARRIVELFPEHQTYVEPFGGAASVLLNKPPSAVEIYNDLDERITRLFRVLRDHGDELRRRLSLTPYSEIEFNQADEPSSDEIEQARRDFVYWRQSIGGRGGSFSFTLHRVRRDMADVVSGYLSTIDEQLPLIIERLRRVQIMQRSAIDVIKNWDSPETLTYCDPPYVHESRTSKSVYDCEMTESDHRQLGETLRKCKGKVVLSGYPSDLYEELYGDWRQVEFEIANHAAGGKEKARMREVVWLNW